MSQSKKGSFVVSFLAILVGLLLFFFATPIAHALFGVDSILGMYSDQESMHIYSVMGAGIIAFIIGLVVGIAGFMKKG